MSAQSKKEKAFEQPLKIAGLTVDENLDVARVRQVLGDAALAKRGDASGTVEKVCYSYKNGTLSIGWGELDVVASLSDGRWHGSFYFFPDIPDPVVVGPCILKAEALPAFSNGLRLGMSKRDAKAMMRGRSELTEGKGVALGTHWTLGDEFQYVRVPAAEIKSGHETLGYGWIQAPIASIDGPRPVNVALYFVDGTCSRIDVVVGD